MCRCINPCFCVPGPAEVGVYVMSLVHSLFITATFVLGLALGYDAVVIIFCTDKLSIPWPVHDRIFYALVLFWYASNFMVEVILREYLYKTIETSTETKIHRCHVWFRARMLQVLLGLPFTALHIYLRTDDLTVILYGIGWVYHLYYTWVVFYYVKLLEKPDSMRTQPVMQNSSQFTIAIDPGVPLSTLNPKSSKKC